MGNKFQYSSRESGLMEHLGELRGRIVWSALIFFVCAAIAYSYAELAFNFLTAPFFEIFAANSLIGTGPAEAFVLKLKVSFFLGFLLSFPFLMYQAWSFVAPGLYESEKRMVFPLAAASTACFGVGVWFCYTQVFPIAFEFFHGQYSSIGVTPTIRISEHLELMLQGMVAFGLIFEVPVVAFLLGRLGIIDHTTLIGWGRYAIVAIFVISAILTPPDAITQLLMAIPLLALYGISIIILRFTATPKVEDEHR